MKRETQAVIFGCASLNLNKKERSFFKHSQPTGFILFERNCHSPAQVRDLIRQLRDSIENNDAPILIDQEGGRVQRLLPPNWTRYLSSSELVKRAEIGGKKNAMRAVELNARLIAYDLSELGITVNCAPVLDVPGKLADPVIGDRAFSDDANKVENYGRAACTGFLAGGVLPILKHIPGHGRAKCDSHKFLPIVDTSLGNLENSDLIPFLGLKDMPWAMTAHVIYSAIDKVEPATTSKTIISELIRKKMKFDGILVSDDLSMGALRGNYRKRAAKALRAGCDLVLHCNGDLEEMELVAEGACELTNAAVSRLERGEQLRKKNSTKLKIPDFTLACKSLEQMLNQS